jgi:hypothetical protein
MSTSVDQSFIRQYESDFHEAFQRSGSYLLMTIRRKPNVIGFSTTFQVIGKGTATTKSRHGLITPMNQSHTPVQCVLADFYAGDWVDKLDELKINIDERLAIARGGAQALGRQIDDQIIDAADTTSLFVGTSTGGVTRALLLQAAEELWDNDVSNDGRVWGLLTPRSWSTAMTIDEFASADFVSDKIFDGGIPAPPSTRRWEGVNWMLHTGLNGKGTATAVNLVYHTDAMGYGIGAAIMADITWHGDRAAHFVNHMMSGGACLIDGNAVVEIRVDDTTAIPAS